MTVLFRIPVNICPSAGLFKKREGFVVCPFVANALVLTMSMLLLANEIDKTEKS